VLYYRGIHRLGPVVANGIMLITPFVTYLTAAIVLREQLDLVELAGGILVVAGGACLVFAKGQVEEIL
jgi:drug/metabolite transporter (DMT)-like permease